MTHAAHAKYFKAIQHTLLCIFVVACAGGEITGSEIRWRYGNFCGDNYPFIRATSASDEIAQLQRIQPVDDIDSICKMHDICYTRSPNMKRDCDLALRENIRSLDFGRDEFSFCKRVAGEVETFAVHSMENDDKTIPGVAEILSIPGYALAGTGSVLMGGYDKIIGRNKDNTRCFSKTKRTTDPNEKSFRNVKNTETCRRNLKGGSSPEYWAAYASCETR